VAAQDRVSEQEKAEIEQRLRDGEWLKIGELMVLFANPNGKPAGRSSVDRWIRNGATFGTTRIKIRYTTDPAGDRYSHPEDIARVLEETRKIRTFEHPDGIPEQ
jgi:hypothetical protein